MGKNVSRKIRSETELQKASDHLYYEIGMFQSLVNGMASGIAGESVINNALLESFGIHTRALLWFFYAENSRDDDVIADDFFSTPTEWQSIRPPLTEILDRAKKRADKEIAHLTYKRIDISPEQKKWQFLPISSDMNKVIDKFLIIVTLDFLGERWNDFKEQRHLKDENGG